MNLRPTDIFYSQSSISNRFDLRTVARKLGVTLDSICEERCSIEALPTITVAKRGDKWVTADNRRLWVLKDLERLGKCDSVPVIVDSDIPSAKLTSTNGGVSVNVRGSPGGEWYKKPNSDSSHYNIVPSRSKWQGWDDTDEDYDIVEDFMKGFDKLNMKSDHKV